MKKSDLFFLYHNTIAHPIAGFCWFFGALLTEVADKIHDSSYKEK